MLTFACQSPLILALHHGAKDEIKCCPSVSSEGNLFYFSEDLLTQAAFLSLKQSLQTEKSHQNFLLMFKLLLVSCQELPVSCCSVHLLFNILCQKQLLMIVIYRFGERSARNTKQCYTMWLKAAYTASVTENSQQVGHK